MRAATKNAKKPFYPKPGNEKNAYSPSAVQRNYSSMRPTTLESRPTSTSSKENSIVNI